MEFSGIDGFLPFRGSFMLDLVFVAMFAIVPVTGLSIWLVKRHACYEFHKRIQLTLGAVLLVAVGAFELDMRINGWRHRAEVSPYYDSWVWHSLYLHLAFAISTAVLWTIVIVQGLRKFPQPARPNEYSGVHKHWAWAAAIDMLFTAVTGWAFYYLAFIAE